MAGSNMYTPMGASSTKARCVVTAHTSHIRVSVSMPEALHAHQILTTFQFDRRFRMPCLGSVLQAEVSGKAQGLWHESQAEECA